MKLEPQAAAVSQQSNPFLVPGLISEAAGDSVFDMNSSPASAPLTSANYCQPPFNVNSMQSSSSGYNAEALYQPGNQHPSWYTSTPPPDPRFASEYTVFQV